jgi:DNA-directed RNA polymerase specialized sigma24 family protein
MKREDSVTFWIARAKTGDAKAAQPLWDRYFRRLVQLARTRLGNASRRVVDEEDAALNAFDSFIRGAAGGRFPQLKDRNNLWPLLVVLTARKVADARRHENRQKRGGGAVQGESALLNRSEDSVAGGIDRVIGDEPTPEFAAEVAEETRRWLEALGSEELRSVALWKIEGYTNAEIAEKLGCVERSVERRLKLIRLLLEKEAAS